MSKYVGVLANSEIESLNKVQDANGNWVPQTKPNETIHMADGNRIDITNDSEVVVFEEWGKRIIIDELHYGTSSFYVGPQLWIREGTSNSFTNQILHGIRGGGGRSLIIPRYVRDYGSAYLEIGQYDNDNDEVSIYLKKPIVLPQGGKLAFSSTSANSGTETSYKVVWREIEG